MTDTPKYPTPEDLVSQGESAWTDDPRNAAVVDGINDGLANQRVIEDRLKGVVIEDEDWMAEPDDPRHGLEGWIPMKDEFFTTLNKRLEGGQVMIRAKDNICPRCGGGVPTNDRRGLYPGALSRTDNLTEICSACGETEAFESFGGRDGLTSQADWRFPPAPGANSGSGKSAVLPEPYEGIRRRLESDG